MDSGGKSTVAMISVDMIVKREAVMYNCGGLVEENSMPWVYGQ